MLEKIKKVIYPLTAAKNSTSLFTAIALCEILFFFFKRLIRQRCFYNLCGIKKRIVAKSIFYLTAGVQMQWFLLILPSK